MSKCNKVKNPCKICLGQVTKKNGLQCQGACKSWVHFECLDYTPGKIRDIKAGVIRVTCPCPDCKSSLPKEYRTDEPYSCRNSGCPANQPPKCANTMCPSNMSIPEQKSVGNVCALSKCGQNCKAHGVPHSPNRPQPPPLPPCKPSPGNLASYNTSSADIPGDFGRRGAPEITMSTLEQMCNTVGQLTNQINCLMDKMRETVQDRRGYHEKRGLGCGQQGCDPKGTKANCRKPCYCPGNPGR